MNFVKKTSGSCSGLYFLKHPEFLNSNFGIFGRLKAVGTAAEVMSAVQFGVEYQ